MHYLSIAVITKEAVFQFGKLYESKQVTHNDSVKLREFHIDILLGKQYFDKMHKEEHAESRLLSLEDFSERYIMPMARPLARMLPARMEIILNQTELPLGLEAATESWNKITMRGTIVWRIELGEEMLRFDIRALDPN